VLFWGGGAGRLVVEVVVGRSLVGVVGILMMLPGWLNGGLC